MTRERITTWANIGTNVSDCRSMEKVLQGAGLDFTVDKCPIYADYGGIITEIKDKRATITSKGAVQGVVSERFEICQNSEAFDFVDYISDELRYERAGMTERGMVYVIGALPEIEILGDAFTPYVIFQNSHNGLYSLRATITPLRIVCQNQFAGVFRKSDNNITIRHTRSLPDRIVAAKEILRKSAEYIGGLNETAKQFAGTRLSHADFSRAVYFLFPDKPDMTDHQREYISEQRNRLERAYMATDNYNFRSTLWGAVNAMADYVTHAEPQRVTKNSAENQFISVTFDPKLMSKFLAAVGV